ncbi:peptidase inhibitor family I36 protein [Streptomyces winkii]|uniref:peptidase inhibitor family I36 protein n=1 Tax=Streptomyces winkii TaxID=3051178 RepID=UPI0028D63A95|nr:peptidase inhibitor family I36 protein [Streptomyces sp. DSM 40971]
MNVLRNRKAATSALAALALAAAGALAGASPAAAASYENCDYGRVCLYPDSDGNGYPLQLGQCGWTHLTGWENTISSVKTHGNAVTLHDAWGDTVGHVGAWTQTNLSWAENDRAQSAFVHC